MEKEIDLCKKYHFPKEIDIKKVEDVYLVIYTEGCLWLVLKERELPVFQALQAGSDIEQCFKEFDQNDVIGVITQIEAKDFEHPRIIEKKVNNLFIYLTNNCNERCKHCYMYAGDIKIEELSVDEWKRVLKQFFEYGGQAVTFSGGEVTVYAGYAEIIRYAHELGLLVTVLSNGIAWTPDDVQTLSSSIDEIQISIDGYDRKSYMAVRNFDGFEKALSTAKLFSKTDCRVSIAVTPFIEGLDEFINGFKDFARKLQNELPDVFIKVSVELLDGRELKVSQEENRQYKQKLKAMVEELMPGFYAETFVLNYTENNRKRNCGFGDITIAANGDVYWCNRIFELESEINVRDFSMCEIMKKAQLVKEATSVEKSGICKDCGIKYICGGGCRIHYPGILHPLSCSEEWKNTCTSERKNEFYQKMISGNEYFYLGYE